MEKRVTLSFTCTENLKQKVLGLQAERIVSEKKVLTLSKVLESIVDSYFETSMESTETKK